MKLGVPAVGGGAHLGFYWRRLVYLRWQVWYNSKFELLTWNTLKSLVTLCRGKGGVEPLCWLPVEFPWETDLWQSQHTQGKVQGWNWPCGLFSFALRSLPWDQKCIASQTPVVFDAHVKNSPTKRADGSGWLSASGTVTGGSWLQVCRVALGSGSAQDKAFGCRS